MKLTFQDSINKLHLRFIKGSFIRLQRITLPDGKEQEITVFSGNNCLVLGQYTPLGTIIVHESVFNNEGLFNYVIAHEMAHKNQWWKFFLLPLAIFVIIQAPTFLNLVLTSVVAEVITPGWDHIIEFMMGIMIYLGLIAIPCLFSWILELDADFQSIKTIGFQKFLDLKNKELKSSKSCLSLIVIINALTHPPTTVIIHIWKWLHSSKKII